MSLIRNLKLLFALAMVQFAGASFAQGFEVVASPSSCAPIGRTCYAIAKPGPDSVSCTPNLLKKIPPQGANMCQAKQTKMCCAAAGSKGAVNEGVIVPGSRNQTCPPHDACSFVADGNAAVGASCKIAGPVKKKTGCPDDMMGKWCCPLSGKTK